MALQSDMNLLKYYFIFNLFYFLVRAAIAFLGFVLEIKMPTGATAGAIIAGSVGSGHFFVSHHGRLPTTAEKWRLVLGSFFLSAIISICLLALALALVPGLQEIVTGIVEDTGVALFVVVGALTTLFYIGLMYLSFGPLLTRIAPKIRKKAETVEQRQEPRVF